MHGIILRKIKPIVEIAIDEKRLSLQNRAFAHTLLYDFTRHVLLKQFSFDMGLKIILSARP
jgi:hypothetical protein